MSRCREAMPAGAHRLGKPAGRWRGVDDSELDVFAAERYFNGDDALCARSSSSFSSAFRTATHDLDRSVAATSSSEASWNSRSALLPDGKVVAAAAAAASSVEAEQPGAGGDERRRGRPPPPPPSSHSHLRRWVLGVAGCICLGGGDGGEDSVSADDGEVEDDNGVGVGGPELITDEEGELFQRRESKELAVGEATSVRVMPGRWLGDGDKFLAGDSNRRAAVWGEFSTPFLNPATTAALHQQRGSCQPLRQLGDSGSAFVSTKRDSAFTIVAGNTARGGGLNAAATAGGGEGEDDAAPSEMGYAYPPSEASVVWSVVTADGAASCNFSSAASGYYYHHINSGEDDGAFRHDARRRNRRRRSGIANSGGLLTCIGDKAVDAVVGARNGGRNGMAARCPDVTHHR